MRTHFRTIDQEVAEEILRLHKKHPNLGHEGLFKVLHESGIKVDETDLRLYMKRKKIGPEDGGTHVPASTFPIGPLSLGPHRTASSEFDAGGDAGGE